MARSVWKGNYISVSLLRNFYKSSNRIKVWSRSSIIPEFLINRNVFVYSGRSFRKIFITREKIGYKFGEFVFSRTRRYKPTTSSKRKIKR